MTASELRDRILKTNDADFAQQCLNLLFDIEGERWQHLFSVFHFAREGARELDKESLEWAQGLIHAAIEDLEKLDNVLEAKKESI